MKLIAAPMATLSHEAFRILVERFGGCDEYFTEMINASSLLCKGPFEDFYLINKTVPQKMVWQLTGSSANAMADAAKVLCKLGGRGIDLNFGCSAPQIYKTGAGIAWMTKPFSETLDLIKKVKAVLCIAEQESGEHKRLSVKCRLGDENFSENNFFSFTDMLVENGVEMITLHARTKKEKYRAIPRYEYVERLALRYPEISIVLNGCISDSESAKNAIKIAPHISAIMIARAAAQKPWIFAELSAKVFGKENLFEKQQVDAEKIALDFISDVEKFQPPEFYKTRLQRFFSYYCLNFSFAHYFKTQMLNAKTPEESRKTLADYFLRCPNDKYLSVYKLKN